MIRKSLALVVLLLNVDLAYADPAPAFFSDTIIYAPPGVADVSGYTNTSISGFINNGSIDPGVLTRSVTVGGSTMTNSHLPMFSMLTSSVTNAYKLSVAESSVLYGVRIASTLNTTVPVIVQSSSGVSSSGFPSLSGSSISAFHISDSGGTKLFNSLLSSFTVPGGSQTALINQVVNLATNTDYTVWMYANAQAGSRTFPDMGTGFLTAFITAPFFGLSSDYDPNVYRVEVSAGVANAAPSQAPAPIPGAGFLSFLGVVVVTLRRRLQAMAR